MDNNLRESITSRLYLGAVMSSMVDMVKYSPEGPKIIGNRKFTVCVRSASGIEVNLFFSKGGCRILEGRDLKLNIILTFKCDRDVNRFFAGETVLPKLTKGIFSPFELICFIRLMLLIKRYLEPNLDAKHALHLRSVHLRLLLRVAFAGMQQLAMHEPRSKNIFQGFPKGIAYFDIKEEGFGSWAKVDGESLTIGRGKPPSPADVIVTFKNSKIAIGALKSEIDPLAAVGTGDITVKGLIPLADGIGQILDRISLFLKF